MEAEVDFKVDRIMDYKIENGVLKYLVRWEGFHPDRDSWEPSEYLQSSAGLLTDFLARTLLELSERRISPRAERALRRALNESNTDGRYSHNIIIIIKFTQHFSSSSYSFK